MKIIAYILLIALYSNNALAEDSLVSSIKNAAKEFAKTDADLSEVGKNRKWVKLVEQKKLVVSLESPDIAEGKMLRKELLAIGRKRASILMEAIDNDIVGVGQPLARVQEIVGTGIAARKMGKVGAFTVTQLTLLPEMEIVFRENGQDRTFLLYNGWILEMLVDAEGVVQQVQFLQATNGPGVNLR